jgi:hypothetical protein
MIVRRKTVNIIQIDVRCDGDIPSHSPTMTKVEAGIKQVLKEAGFNSIAICWEN